MSSYNDDRFKANALPDDGITKEYKTLAENFENFLAAAYKKASEQNAKPDEKPSTIKINVTSISKATKPRVEGDLEISFQITEGGISSGQNLMQALNDMADPSGAPRSFSSTGSGFKTHLKPRDGMQ